MNNKTRQPKCVGQGEMMTLQSYGNLIQGDWVWDVDLGVLVWDGKDWIQQNDYLKYLKN